jgi:hypothetical protein
MQSTQNPKHAEPQDVLEIAPDVVLVAPTEDELSRLAHAMRQPANPPPPAQPDPAAPSVPPVDTRFRAASIDRPSAGGQAIRNLVGSLLVAGIGVAIVGWQVRGDEIKQALASWTPPFVLTLFMSEKAPPPVSPAVETATATPVPSQVAALAEPAPQNTATVAGQTSADAAQMQAMASDLAGMRQEIDGLKAAMAQLKAGQDQVSRNAARVSDARAFEPNLRPRPALAPPLRPATAPPHKPPPSVRPAQAAMAPVSPRPAAAPYPAVSAPAPYVARQADPQPSAAPPADPELASVPRPPMPVR